VTRPRTLDAAEIIGLLPHRHPFLLLDRVEDLIAGESAVGVKNVSISDPVFAGHFPGRPVFPGVLLVEASAQTCGIVLAATMDTPVLGYLASIKRFKFIEIVRPGDRLRIRANVGVSVGALTEFSVELRSDTSVVASGSLAVALAES